MTNLLAVLGSPRKGKGTDKLMDEAIRGAREARPGLAVEKINLIDRDIKHCRNCLTCRDTQTGAAPAPTYAPCVINDDMAGIFEKLEAAEVLLLGTPVHMGFATGLMTMFLERICWTFAQPTKRYLTISNCPEPRSDKRRRAGIIVTTGIIPPLYRRFCDQATPLIKQTLADSLNATTVGSLYAGALESKGLEPYLSRAYQLGRKLV